MLLQEADTGTAVDVDTQSFKTEHSLHDACQVAHTQLCNAFGSALPN
jgi:hypothetical protein